MQYLLYYIAHYSDSGNCNLNNYWLFPRDCGVNNGPESPTGWQEAEEVVVRVGWVTGDVCSPDQQQALKVLLDYTSKFLRLLKKLPFVTVVAKQLPSGVWS